MAADDLFVCAQHPRSRRWAIVEDDGRAAWLYLTLPDSERPVADCWLYNVAPDEPGFARGEAPVVPAEYAGERRVPPAPEEVSFAWSADGESVAVLFDGALAGFIAAGQRHGFSAGLRKAGPFGAPLDRALYERVFGAAEGGA